MQKPEKQLYGPDNTRLEVKGMFRAKFQHKGLLTEANFYVICNVSMLLLSRGVITKLNLLARVDSVNDMKMRILSIVSDNVLRS